MCAFARLAMQEMGISIFYICQDELVETEWKKIVEQVMAALYTEARALNGLVSGEHGIGHAKCDFLRKSIGDTQIRLMRGIKAAFDPKGIINPGKVIDYEDN